MSITCDRSAACQLASSASAACGIRRQDVDGVGIGHRIVHQVMQRAHRLGIRVLGVQRIRVELQARRARERQRRQGGEYQQDRPPAPRNDRVERRRPRRTDLCRFASRAEQGDAAGRKPSVQMNAISMPAPAIRPSSATPEKSVGTKAQKTRRRSPGTAPGSGTPARRRSVAAPRRVGTLETAARGSAPKTGSRSHGNSDEQDAKADRNQIQRADRHGGEQHGQHEPEPQRSRIGRISRQVRTARNSHRVISSRLPIRPVTAPCATVANSSSASAT